MKFTKENILKGIKELENKRKEIQKELDELDAEIRLEKMMLSNEIDKQEDSTKKTLNNLFESFASAQQDNIDFDSRLNKYINKITKK